MLKVKQRCARGLAVVVMASTLSVLTITPAMAAPSNDKLPGAKVIPGVPYVATTDTTTATRGKLDSRVCTADDTNYNSRSVWYRYTPSTNRRIEVDTVRSDYLAYIAVFLRTAEGVVPSWDPCSSTSGLLEVEAGKTYYIMAFDYPYDSRSGGQLRLRVREPVRTTLTIEGAGDVSQATGDAVIRGSVSCSRASTVTVSASVRQRINDTVIATGSGYANGMACKPTSPAIFSTDVYADQYPFKAGNAGVRASVQVCDDAICDYPGEVRGIVNLGWVTR
jgi:hypothetical protein